ncbi:MAG: hypothetical protein IPK82_01255 [Polyangiaceae bacterium]|nr:hypothetical protein [Polyangiaceae bacterium]
MRTLFLSWGRLCTLAAALSVGTVGCFFEEQPIEELFDVPFQSDTTCVSDGMCRSDNPCVRGFCSYENRCVFVTDNSLIPDDGLPCTEDTCLSGQPLHTPLSQGSPCGVDFALTCNGNGACVGCEGDGSDCGPAAPCHSWTCSSGECVMAPAPAGLPLPIANQIPNDCGLLQCNGLGVVETVLYDDPILEGSCFGYDCFDGHFGPRPAGVVCGGVCLNQLVEVMSLQLFECDGAGVCSAADVVECSAGNLCSGNRCLTSCTSTAECVSGTECVDGDCRFAPGPKADCQTFCKAKEALDCPVELGEPACEPECFEKVVSACAAESAALMACRAQAAASSETCAELLSSCSELELAHRLCTQEPLPPDGPGCNLNLPCVSGFDGCTCAAFCDGSLVVDQCLPSDLNPEIVTCSCAKNGVTLKTCEISSGCGISTGCCAGVL